VRPVLNEILDIVLAWFTVFAPSANHDSRLLVRMSGDDGTHEAGQEMARLLTTFRPAA